MLTSARGSKHVALSTAGPQATMTSCSRSSIAAGHSTFLSSSSSALLKPARQTQPHRPCSWLMRPLRCMQSGGRTLQPTPAPQGSASGSALVRRPVNAPTVQPIYLEASQLANKQVITRGRGTCLGLVSNMWVDPRRAEVVSLDLETKKNGMGSRTGNIPLSSLRQIGDVVLVEDDDGMYPQDVLDGRYGFMVLTGMEVRTQSGGFLGRVRDFSFSPDNGQIARLVYDDFGLTFLPREFFTCHSLQMSDVLALGPAAITVTEDAKRREVKENDGIFAAIPSLLRSLGSRALDATADGYRGAALAAGGGPATTYLPSGYTYDEWVSQVRRWEQETGLSYDEYVRNQQQQQQQLPAPQQQQQYGQQAYAQQQYSQQLPYTSQYQPTVRAPAQQPQQPRALPAPSSQPYYPAALAYRQQQPIYASNGSAAPLEAASVYRQPLRQQPLPQQGNRDPRLRATQQPQQPQQPSQRPLPPSQQQQQQQPLPTGPGVAEPSGRRMEGPSALGGGQQGPKRGGVEEELLSVARQ